MNRSTGTNSGLSHVRSPSKTRAMYAPMGLVRARIIRKKTTACSHPIEVIRIFRAAASRKRGSPARQALERARAHHRNPYLHLVAAENVQVQNDKADDREDDDPYFEQHVAF